MKAYAIAAVSLVSLLLPQVAGANPGFGFGGGFGKGMGMGVNRCMRMLMHAPPDLLKAKLGLSDQQVQQIQPVRTNVLSKSITLGAQAAQLALQLKTAIEADLPDQGKVIDLLRKIRNLRGQIVEEQVKAGLKAMQIMSKEQRTKLRAHCGKGGKGQDGHGGWGGHGGRRGHGGGGGHGGGADF